MKSLYQHLATCLVLACTTFVGCAGEAPEELISSAKTYLESNDTEAATIQLKNALQINPDLPEARFLLGKALLESDEPVAAIVELRKAEELDYAPDAVVPTMAKALLLQGQYKKLVDEYAGKQLADSVATADLWTSVALAHGALGDLKRSQSILEAALRSTPGYVPARLAQASQLANKHDIDGALVIVDRVLHQTPADDTAWVLRGDLLLRGQDDSDGALEAYSKAIASRADSLGGYAGLFAVYLSRNDEEGARAALLALDETQRFQPQARYFEAVLALKYGDLKKAAELVQMLVTAYPDNARVLKLAGSTALRTGSLVQSERFLSKALQVAPHVVDARSMLTHVYLRLGQPEKALKVAERLLQQRPDVATLSLMGTAYLQKGELREAEETFANARDLDPKNANTRTSLALTHLRLGKSALAFDELQSISDTDSGTTADLAMISSYLQRKELDAALRAIEKLERKQPDQPIAADFRGRVQGLKGNIAAARRSFEHAITLDPTFFPSVHSLAAIDLRAGNPEQAEKRYAKLLEAQPTHAGALLAVVRLGATTGKSNEEVLSSLTNAVALNPQDIALRLALVDHHLSHKETTLALEAVHDAMGAVPESPQMLDALGRAQLANGEVNQAISSFNKLAALQPRSARVLVALADAHVIAKNVDAALQSLARALQLDPTLLVAKRNLVALKLATGRTSEAMSLAREIQKEQPDKAVGFQLEADIEASRKNWSVATSVYRAALQKEATTQNVVRLHSSLLASGKRAEAGVTATAWLKENPQDADFSMYLGNVALKERDYLAAEHNFARAVKLQPDNAIAHNNLAWCLVKLKRPGGLEHAEQANKLQPNDPSIMDTLASLLDKSGKTSQAIELQKEAIALQPENHRLHLSLARLYLRAGDKSLARQELEPLKLLGETFPDFKEVEQLWSTL